jgi:hypothetical protein
MRRRKLLVALAGLAVVLVVTGTTVVAGLGVMVAAGAIVFALWPEPSSRITSENFDRRRRRKLLLVLVGVAVVVAAEVVVLWPWREPVSPITRANYERIQLGMSLAEVTDMLGPLGDRRTCDTEPDPAPPVGLPNAAPTRPGHKFVALWDGDHASILVYVSPEDLVVGKQYLAVRPTSTAGPFNNFLWRAKRWWRHFLDRGPFDRSLWSAKHSWHRWFP